MLVICFILLESFFVWYLANSGIRRLEKDLTKMSGNIIIGSAIPLIIPYLERDSVQFIPLFSKLEGIINCFKVVRPDLIYDVIAIGIEILTIRCV